MTLRGRNRTRECSKRKRRCRCRCRLEERVFVLARGAGPRNPFFHTRGSQRWPMHVVPCSKEISRCTLRVNWRPTTQTPTAAGSKLATSQKLEASASVQRWRPSIPRPNNGVLSAEHGAGASRSISRVSSRCRKAKEGTQQGST